MATTLNFQQLFGRSPFPAVQAHMRLAMRCVKRIPYMLEAIAAEDEETLKHHKRKVFELESQADKIYDELGSQLPKSMFMPVHRHDLIQVLQRQEDIADTAQDIAGLLQLPLHLPAELVGPLIALAKIGVQSSKQALKVIDSLDELIASGFKGPDVPRVLEMIDEISKIEDGADDLGIEITASIYEQREYLDPINAMMLFQLVRWLGNLSDHAQLIGSGARFLIAK